MSRRAAIWGAAALSLIFVLLLSAVLLQPALGSDGGADRDGVINADQWSEMTGGDANGWDDEGHDDNDHGNHEGDEHDGHEDDDDD
jgi:hypothetical protein